MGRIRLNSHQDTVALGVKMATRLPPHAIIALTGDLGAGKTTFVQGLAIGLGIQEPIQSPTFVLLNNYNDQLFHFDLYRLKEGDFIHLGFEEYFHKGICAIEWPDRILNLLPATTIFIHFHYDGQGRIAEIRS